MPDLPATRVVAKSVFFYVGIDLFGPVTVECATCFQKRWVTLFTCLLTQAIHLEATTDLSAQSFLHSFRRFVARKRQTENHHQRQSDKLEAHC